MQTGRPAARPGPVPGGATPGPGGLRGLAMAVSTFPTRPAVGRFDAAVECLVQDHMRGRRSVDLVMYTASAVGDHGMCWLAVAAWKGWRSGHLGQLTGRTALALGAESALVNGLVKLAFRRKRPVSQEPRPLPLRTPRSSSFPSGHASSAFFAAAVLRERRTWPLYYLAALTVATSRAHVKIHHGSDVVAGALLGALLGEVARPLVRGTSTPPAPL